MTRTMMLAASALALSAGGALAQTVVVTPDYDYIAPPPAYVAPPPVYIAPRVVRRTTVIRRTEVARPVYDYAPAYSETVVVGPGW